MTRLSLFMSLYIYFLFIYSRSIWMYGTAGNRPGFCLLVSFGRNKVIFHPNVYLAVFFCVGVLGL